MAEHAWYEADELRDDSQLAAEVRDLCKQIEEDQYELHRQNLDNARLYSNREMMALSWGNPLPVTASHAPVSKLTENLVLSVVDTMVSQVGKNKPKATPVTKGADFKLRREAKKLDQWLYARFHKHDVWAKGKSVFRDACIMHVGALYIDRDGSEICVERVNPDEIVVDQKECVSCDLPRQLFRRRVVTIDTLCSLFPDKEYEVLEVAARSAGWVSYRGPGRNHVVLVEAWALPQKGSRGRYVATVDNVLLESRPYTRDWFPFAFFRWQEPLAGFYGVSAVEQILPYQIRLNELNMAIRDGQDLMVRPRIWKNIGTEVVASKFDQRIGRIHTYRGQKPEADIWQGAGAELYQERDRVIASCYQFFGVSQLSSQGKLPQGNRLDSSEALREYNAIEDQRFADVAQRYEAFYMQVAELMIKVATEIGGDSKGSRGGSGGQLSTSWRRANRAGNIAWNEINLDRDNYVIIIEPSSTFNETPAARKDQVATLVQSGTITPMEAKLLTRNPDLEHTLGLIGAAGEVADWCIDELEDGNQPEPDVNMDLGFTFARVQQAYCVWLTLKNKPDYLLDDGLEFLARTDALLKMGEKPADTGDMMSPVAPPDAAATVGAAPVGMPGMVPPVDPNALPLPPPQ